MYNLKTLSGILVRLPASNDNLGFAGPPFQMPYTLSLPIRGGECWGFHQRLIHTSQKLCNDLIGLGISGDSLRYVRTLQQLDLDTEVWLTAMERKH
jgi:hypothetical protein